MCLRYIYAWWLIFCLVKTYLGNCSTNQLPFLLTNTNQLTPTITPTTITRRVTWPIITRFSLATSAIKAILTPELLSLLSLCFWQDNSPTNFNAYLAIVTVYTVWSPPLHRTRTKYQSTTKVRFGSKPATTLLGGSAHSFSLARTRGNYTSPLPY